MISLQQVSFSALLPPNLQDVQPGRWEPHGTRSSGNWWTMPSVFP